MKSNKDFRGKQEYRGSDELRKSVKLQPAKKSGRERKSYSSYGDEENDEMSLYTQKRESVFDYFDDEEQSD